MFGGKSGQQVDKREIEMYGFWHFSEFDHDFQNINSSNFQQGTENFGSGDVWHNDAHSFSFFLSFFA